MDRQRKGPCLPPNRSPGHVNLPHTRSQPDVQHVVSRWPAVQGFKSSPKVPTELRKVGSSWQWGFQIPEGEKKIRLFKLYVSRSSIGR